MSARRPQVSRPNSIKSEEHLRRLAHRSVARRHKNLPPFPTKTYDIVYADPPWFYYGSQIKDAAAAKHYPLMDQAQLAKLPVRSIMNKRAVLFLWSTGPRLNFALELIESWRLYYRGVAYVWVKTNQQRSANPRPRRASYLYQAHHGVRARGDHDIYRQAVSHSRPRSGPSHPGAARGAQPQARRVPTAH